MNIPTAMEAKLLLKPQAAHLEGFLGAILLGSVSAGMQDATSDYDIQLIFEDEACAAHPEYDDLSVDIAGRKVDLWHCSISELAAMERDAPETKEYIHAEYLMDASGRLRSAVESVVRIPEAERLDYVGRKLDSYYNGLYRSLKCKRHGYELGYYMMACESVNYYIDVVFGLNGTVAPFVNRAPRLMKKLETLPAPADALSSILLNVASTAEIPVQIALFDMTRAWMALNGYKHIQDAWEGVLEREVDGFRRSDH